MNEKKIQIDLMPFVIIVAVICFTVLLRMMVVKDAQIETEREKTKQIELQLQIEQEKNK